MKQNESHVIYTMTGLMAAAFIAATAYTGFNPAEIIPQLDVYKRQPPSPESRIRQN